MSARDLIVRLDDREIGRVVQDAHGRLQFSYHETWLQAPDAYPLSLSMPLRATPHPHAKIEAFIWGLLPDNATVLDSWSKQFRVSARNAFGLISHVGEDCAGAVQFVRPERLDALRTTTRGSTQWISEAEIGERLRLLRKHHGAWRMAQDRGQFSLAGAQPKTALLFEKGRWGVPSGRVPTTHILKPPNAQLDGFPENEHLCLELARALSLPTASSRIMHFDGEAAIVVERYDRIHTRAGWVRIHQEDFCQALGLDPGKKYQPDGGPGARAIVELLRLHSFAAPEDEQTFLDALILNWLIAGTDAHAKNYSLLIAAKERVRLAPLYDVASVLPYSQFDVNNVKLAMKIGGKYKLRDIGLREWRKLAQELGTDAGALIDRIARMARAIPDQITDISKTMRTAGLQHGAIDRLATRLIGRSKLCLTQLRTPTI